MNRIIRVYLVAEDGSDRIYVSTTPPNYVRNKKNSHVFAADVELPEVVTLDSGVVRVLANEIEDPPNKAVSVFRDKYNIRK